MKTIFLLLCIIIILSLSNSVSKAETMPAPVSPTPPPITPGTNPSNPSPGSYSPGSSYGASYSDREFKGFFDASIRLTQSLWEGGATAAQIAIQRSRLDTANLLLEDAATSLAFDAIVCHVDILRRREMVLLAEENVKNHERMLSLLKKRVQDGLAGIGDVHQVESRLFRARGSLAEYIGYLQATEANFFRITGKPAPKNLASVAPPSKVYDSPSTVIEACQKQHPRIKAAFTEIGAYEHEKDLASSRNYPHFSAEIGPRWYYQDTSRDSTNHGFDAMLVMRWNLYEGGATTAAKEAASAKKRQATHVLHRTVDIFTEDIYATWARYESAQKQVKYYKQAMQSAKASRIAFQEQYLLGTRNLLDVLDAENDYFNSASQFMVAEGDQIIASWRLLTLGGDILQILGVDVRSLKN